jgi:tetratricopeptide (TPR) repeat protein
MSKRLAMLEAMTAGGSTDPFAWYGLAMEYKNQERLDDARAAFERLRDIDPNYLAGYYMGGQVLVLLEQFDEARRWFEQGLSLAAQQGNPKTESELREALDELADKGR